MAPPELTFVYKGYRVLAFTSPSPYRRYWAWVSFDLFPGMPGAHPRHLVPGEFSDPQAALIAADGYAKGRIDRGEGAERPIVGLQPKHAARASSTRSGRGARHGGAGAAARDPG